MIIYFPWASPLTSDSPKWLQNLWSTRQSDFWTEKFEFARNSDYLFDLKTLIWPDEQEFMPPSPSKSSDHNIQPKNKHFHKLQYSFRWIYSVLTFCLLNLSFNRQQFTVNRLRKCSVNLSCLALILRRVYIILMTVDIQSPVLEPISRHD